MPNSGRVAFTLDALNRRLIIRYQGNISGYEIVNDVIAYLKTLDEFWTYDVMIDMRRFEGVLLSADNETFAKWWYDNLPVPDPGHYSAIISTDPHIQARLAVSQSIFPNHVLAVFTSLDEGLDWLTRMREAHPLIT